MRERAKLYNVEILLLQCFYLFLCHNNWSVSVCSSLTFYLHCTLNLMENVHPTDLRLYIMSSVHYDFYQYQDENGYAKCESGSSVCNRVTEPWNIRWFENFDVRSPNIEPS